MLRKPPFKAPGMLDTTDSCHTNPSGYHIENGEALLAASLRVRVPTHVQSAQISRVP